jgi:hypothetical protein
MRSDTSVVTWRLSQAHAFLISHSVITKQRTLEHVRQERHQRQFRNPATIVHTAPNVTITIRYVQADSKLLSGFPPGIYNHTVLLSGYKRSMCAVSAITDQRFSIFDIVHTHSNMQIVLCKIYVILNYCRKPRQ